MNFGQAIESLKLGSKLAREGWNGKGMYLQLYTPQEDEGVILVSNGVGKWHESLPYIGIKTADDKYVPWLASQTDMLAEDWVIVLD